MAYIGKVKVSKEWTTLVSLIQSQVEGQSAFSFDADTTYQLQGETDSGVRLVEMSSTPDDRREGNRIVGTQVAFYVKDTPDLYVRAVAEYGDQCLLKISTTGD